MSSNDNHDNKVCSIVYVNNESAVINNTYKAILGLIQVHIKDIVKEVFTNPQEEGYTKLYKNLFGNFFEKEE